MNQTRTCARSAWALATCSVLAVVALGLVSGLAHSQVPTPEQLELLKSLPADQQQAIIEQAAKRGDINQSVDAPLTPAVTERPKPQPATEQGRPLIPGAEDLEPFGYDVFNNVPTTFAPATDIPVPAEYVLGPGDTLEVQLIGDRGGHHTLTVGRDGTVDFPNLGPIAVAGQRFPAAKAMLEQSVSEQMIETRASVSMGSLRSVRVFILGEAVRPGSYTVSGLSTITNALFASGGVKAVGSLRNIQLKRDGRVVARLDLYDLLINGDTSGDVRLRPGDVIFIPPVGIAVGVAGEVMRPAIYEVKPGARTGDLLALTGGLTPQADPRTARLNRIEDRLNRTILNIDLTTAAGRATEVRTGDLIRIQPIRQSLEGAVRLSGHVHRERLEQFRTGMRLVDLVQSLDELQPLSDRGYVLIKRESGPDRQVSVLSANLAAAFGNPASAANVALQPRDQVFVFDLASSREKVTQPILEDLRRQSGNARHTQVVAISGRIKVPGEYPLEAGMRVSDLLRAGGGLDQAAYEGSAELTRYAIVSGERRQTEVIPLQLAGILRSDTTADIELQPFDSLLIQEMPDWREQETIELTGEVHLPGRYTVRPGETLRSVLLRAGGFTDQGFAEGSVFTRVELKQREQMQLDELSDRLQRELALLSLQTTQEQAASDKSVGQTVAAGQGLLASVKSTEAMGRLVISLDDVMGHPTGSTEDILLRGGDRLVVPRRTQEVTVIGEVQGRTSHLHKPNQTGRDYIERSGGYTPRADEKHVYVIKADGEVIANGSHGWLRSGGVTIRPGDTIVVPINAQQMRPLTTWTSITQILYNIAVAVAAVNSF